MNVLTFDFECTTWNKGNPFDKRNFAVCLAVKWLGRDDSIVRYYDEDIQHLQEEFDRADLLIAFNAKFDLHWLRKVGIDFSGKLIWDCQLGEFLIDNQKNPYPSLEDTAVKYNLGHKIDTIKLEYWDKGINTNDIPREILTPYAIQDVALTEQVYLIQKEKYENEQNSKFALFKLQCSDLLVLEQMEWDGIRFDTVAARKKAHELQKELDVLYKEMVQMVGNVPFNLNSGDHLSAILYGGSIIIDNRIPIGEYKSGQKIGQTRYKIVQKEYKLPRLVEPLEKTEIKKPLGSPPVWKTNEDVLRSLKLTKEAKKIVHIFLEYSGMEKLRGTYLEGWSNMIDEQGWEKDTIHGQLNQCVAVTGRLSSSKPNLQNADPVTKTFCVSKYNG